MKNILAALGLPETATEDQIVSAIKELQEQATASSTTINKKVQDAVITVITKVRAALGLGVKATEEDVVESIKNIQGANAVLKEQLELTKSKPATAADKREGIIRKKIAESGGALNRAGAEMVIDHQATQDAKKK